MGRILSLGWLLTALPYAAALLLAGLNARLFAAGGWAARAALAMPLGLGAAALALWATRPPGAGLAALDRDILTGGLGLAALALGLGLLLGLAGRLWRG